MEVYVRDVSSNRKLQHAGQGYAEAVADLEKIANGRLARPNASSPRLKSEKGCLCQADGKDWQSRGRFVWALSSNGQKALLEGHIDDHVSGKYKTDYDRLKTAASKRTDKDFEGAIKLSSEEIIKCAEIERLAQKATKKREINWIENLQETFQEWKKVCPNEPDLVETALEDAVHELCHAHPEITAVGTGFLTNKEFASLTNRFSTHHPFRITMEKIRLKIKNKKTNKELLEAASSNTNSQKMTDITNTTTKVKTPLQGINPSYLTQLSDPNR